MRKTRAAMLIAPLSASMLLSGCGGGSKPDASPSIKSTTSATTTTSPTTSASPTSTASPTSPKTDPNIPAAARAHTPAGARAFVGYFYSQVNSAWTKPRSGLISALSAPNCKSCAALEATATDLVKAGQHYNGPPVTIISIDHLGEGIPGHPEILVRFTQENRSVINRAGHVVLTDKRKQGKFVATIEWSARGWSISTVKSLA